MYKRIIHKKLGSIGVLIIALGLPGMAQFGKNKVQYDAYNWSFLQTENADIYFYDGGQELAEFAAPVAEQALRDISSVLNWRVRKRVSLLIYNSHSDFQQTNVTLDYMTEGIGGFTEIFKNRAVVAFDGSYYGFGHVIRHELVHVVINDLIYGGNIQSVVSGRVRLRIPEWMNEGLAEFISAGWDTPADQVMRDIALSNDIPNVEQLDYYLAYKGGQSVYRFIAEKYGVEKIGQIWAQMKGRGSAEKGLKSTIGLSMEDLTEKWHRWLRTLYWPDVADRNEIREIATRLTDHQKSKNYFNTGPAISPNGDKIAIMSDRKGYADIFLISATDGKVLKKVLGGQRTPDLEELKWLNPRLSWSPDGKNIVLAVKSGIRDALIIIDVNSGKRRRLTFPEVEEIFTAAWSPDGQSIALIGLKDDRSDIYLYQLKSKKLERLTNDRFAEFEPAWSPDGQRLAFASQRGRAADSSRTGELTASELQQTDLFYIDIATRAITRLTDSPWSENYPVWANTRPALIYTSDYEGISNLFVMDLERREGVAVTNVLTGVFQPSLSRDDQRLVFAGYADYGWDVYAISNPLELAQKPQTIKPTVYAQELQQQWSNPEKFVRFKNQPEGVKSSYTRRVSSSQSYSNYIFAPNLENVNPPAEADTSTTTADTIQYLTDDGKYRVNPYKTKFTLDLIQSQAGYSTFWGLQGTTVFDFSDVMGNHRLSFGTELYVDLENSDYYLTYMYLAKRVNFAVTGFHSANFWSLNFFQMYRLRNYGADLAISRPSTKFSRIEMGATSYNVERSLINILTGTTDTVTTINTILPHIGYVYDNSLWGYISPIDGWRARTDLLVSPRYQASSLEFYTVQFDVRRYFKLNREYSFALRLSGGLSNGRNAQRFFLGGEENWINQRWRTAILYEDNSSLLEDIYFSDFVTPLRGARYYERAGTRYFLTNFEFRYPFVKYLSLGWPFPLVMGGIQGVSFLDLGSAWYPGQFHPFQNTTLNGLGFDDLVGGYGCGTRLILGYFLLKIDVAWRFDLDTVSKPIWYFSLGLDF